MLMRLSENDGALVVSYASWVGIVFVLMGIALAAYLVRRFTMTGKTFGFVAAAFVCLYGGIHFLGFKAEMDSTGVRVYEPFRRDARVTWKQVRGVRIEERGESRGKGTHLVFEGGPEPVDFRVTALTAEDRVKLLELAARHAKVERPN